MKKLLSLTLLLALSPLCSAHLLEKDSNNPNAWQTAKFKLEGNAKDFFNVEAILKRHEEQTLKQIFISKTEDPKAVVYLGEAWFPLCEDSDLERVKTKGLVTEKYLVPLGFELQNNYQHRDQYSEAFFNGSSYSNRVFTRLAGNDGIFTNADVHVELTAASKYSVKLNEPIYKTDENGSVYYVDKKITAEQRRKASSTTGRYMVPDPNKAAGDDSSLDRELVISYPPKYYSLKVVFGASKDLYDCASPAMAAKGVKCGVAPVEAIKSGSQVIEFYLVPDIETMAKDLKFVKQAVDQAYLKK